MTYIEKLWEKHQKHKDIYPNFITKNSFEQAIQEAMQAQKQKDLEIVLEYFHTWHMNQKPKDVLINAILNAEVSDE